MSKFADRIAKIQEKIDQEQQRLRDLKARETAQERKDDTRRKILYGAAFLSMIDQFTEERRKNSLDAIHKTIERSKDRKFLGLPPRCPEDKPKFCSEMEKGSAEPQLPSAAIE